MQARATVHTVPPPIATMTDQADVSPDSPDEPQGRRTGSFRPDEIDQIPRRPGVYLMFDARGKVIYVGKAVDLRARVRQYFAGADDRMSVPLILESLRHIETIVTLSEKEAFLLENTLIKRHRPRYNVRLRDDKTYVSVRIDPGEAWPRATVTRVRKRDKALYFGPYANARAIRRTLRFLQKAFPLRSCSDAVFRNRSRPCILHSIGRCCAPCCLDVSPEQYEEYVRNTILFLRGRTGELVDALRARMREHSENMEYEKAAVVRDRIQAIEESVAGQKVASHESTNRDVVGMYEQQGQAALSLHFFRSGQLVETMNWIVPTYGEPRTRALSQFLGQYYGEGRLVPSEVLLSDMPDDAAIVEEWLGDLRGARCRLLAPQRGEKRHLVEMAEANARENLERRLSGRDQIEANLADLARRLQLAQPPRWIECYDIATLQGAQSAGSQVVFRDGEPSKPDYRLYRIRGVAGQDDFAMMNEVLSRRFRHAAEKSEALPDLVLVDGGRGQLGAAHRALEEAGVAGEVALAAIAKERLRESDEDQKTRTPERLFVPGRKNPVAFPPRAPAFYLLQRLRDEAHRFVNTYHRKIRGRANLRSSLVDIPGIGEKRARALLRHFGSLARIRQASIDDLAQAPGMNAPLARTVFECLRREEEA